MGATTLAEQLSGYTHAADPALVAEVADRPGWIRCYACGHRCKIGPGREGVCKVRFSKDGELRVPWGYVAAVACDPIEKKPFFHVDPGGLALSFGMLGCDLHCAYCQNWDTSQAIRDPDAGGRYRRTTPEAIAAAALEMGAGFVVSTYNEPLITLEWALDVFAAARARGLATAFVSNGNATPEALDRLAPSVDAYKVDLKCFDDGRYRKLGCELENVKDTIVGLVERGIWCEVVTLVVPDFSDDDAELANLASWLAGVSPDIPWHVTAYHPDYKMTDRNRTPMGTLRRAAAAGRAAGLRYVYAGNCPGNGLEDTLCPTCGETVVRRSGFRVLDADLDDQGACANCQTRIPGRWQRRSRASGPGFPLGVTLTA